MAGLLDIFGTSGADTMGLLGMSPEDIKRNREDAQAQALYALAGRLFQGGNTGASIAQGLQQGQQAYKTAMQAPIQEQLQNVQLADMIRKRQQEQQALAEQQRVQGIVQKAYRPEVFAETPLTNIFGQEIAGHNQPQAKGTGLTQDVVNQLMTSEQGQAKLAQLAKLVPEMRKANLTGQQQQENPFTMFAQDETLPANLKLIAKQYEKSFSTLDQETVDKRVTQLGEMAQRAAQFQQTADAAKTAKEANLAIAQGNQAIQRMMAEFKIEEKQAKTAEKADVKAEAKKQLSDVVGQLKNSYDTLLEGGGITSTATGGRENIGAKMGTSAVGQFVGSALGTKNQEQRQVIEQTRPLLLNLIKEATGMSASQMNSNAEMQMYLKAATDPKLSYEANVKALQNLDKTFGLGILKDITPPKKKAEPTSSGW
jgi:hypothetical protein